MSERETEHLLDLHHETSCFFNMAASPVCSKGLTLSPELNSVLIWSPA